jgi:hypothetical protein
VQLAVEFGQRIGVAPRHLGLPLVQPLDQGDQPANQLFIPLAPELHHRPAFGQLFGMVLQTPLGRQPPAIRQGDQKPQPLFERPRQLIEIGVDVRNRFVHGVSLVPVIGTVAEDHILVRRPKQGILLLFRFFGQFERIERLGGFLQSPAFFRGQSPGQLQTDASLAQDLRRLGPFSPIHLDPLEEGAQAVPVLGIGGRASLRFDCGHPHPALQQGPIGVDPRLEGYGLSLAEPLDQQVHRGDGVALPQQQFDDGRTGPGRVERLDMLLPEGKISRPLTRRPPRQQHFPHPPGRIARDLTQHRLQIGDGGRGELIPPGGQGVKSLVQVGHQLGLTGGGRLAFDPAEGVEDLVHHRQQPVDPRIGHGVFPRGEQREMPLEAQNVPRIGQGSALDSPVQEIDRRVETVRRLLGLLLVHRENGLGQLQLDFGVEAGRGGGNDAGLPPRRRSIPHPRVQPRQLRPLQLLAPVVGQIEVEVLANLAKRLLHQLRLAAQPLGMLAGHRLQQHLVKRVALPGHPRQQVGQADARIVRVGTGPADRRGHQHRTRQHRRRLAELFLLGNLGGRLHPVQQRVENHAAHHKPPVTTRDVHQVRVPLAEGVIRTAVDRVRVVVRPQVERQFVQQVEVEVGPGQHGGGHRPQNLDRPRDHRLVPAVGHPHLAQIQRNGSMPLVRVGLHPPAIFEHRHRPMPEVIIQLAQRPLHQPLRLGPGPPLRQGRLEDPCHKERIVEQAGVDMGQQVGMVSAVGGNDLIENRFDHSAGLADIGERPPLGRQQPQPVEQQVAQGDPRRFLVQQRTKPVEPPLELGVGLAIRKVEVAQHLAEGGVVLGRRDKCSGQSWRIHRKTGGCQNESV